MVEDQIPALGLLDKGPYAGNGIMTPLHNYWQEVCERQHRALLRNLALRKDMELVEARLAVLAERISTLRQQDAPAQTFAASLLQPNVIPQDFCSGFHNNFNATVLPAGDNELWTLDEKQLESINVKSWIKTDGSYAEQEEDESFRNLCGQGLSTSLSSNNEVE